MRLRKGSLSKLIEAQLYYGPSYCAIFLLAFTEETAAPNRTPILLASNSVVLLVLELTSLQEPEPGRKDQGKPAAFSRQQLEHMCFSSSFADPASPLRIWLDFEGPFSAR